MNMKKIISLFLCITLFCGTFYAFAEGLNEKPNANNLHSVACIFAGREKYMSVLMPYLHKLQEDGKLTEINLWQFTNKSSDIEYLESISNLHKTSKNFTKYRKITPRVENNAFNIKIKAHNDASILINGKYEIILGGWGNTKSVIREGIQGKSLCEKSHRALLNPNKYKNFKISLKNNILSVKGLISARVGDSDITSIEIHTGYGSEGYWDYEETENKNIKLFDTEKRSGFGNWYEAYKYYLDYDFDLLLKIDDDIVYMDLDRYDEFVKYIIDHPNKNCIMPNMVNHAVSLFYNNKYNLVPNEVLPEQYVGKKSPDDVYYYYKDGHSAESIHKYFLNNTEKFSKNNMPAISLDNHKESICMFGILKKNFDKIFKPSFVNKIVYGFNGKSFKNTEESFDDEVHVYNCKGNVFYPRFVVSHYQFGPQIKNGLDDSLLAEYRQLSEKIK